MLETLPKILIVQLKRFKIMNLTQKKLNYCINIPYDIGLDFLLKEKEKYINNTLYNLFGVIVHVGSGSEYGHYYCLIKVAGKWVKFDDDILTVSNDNNKLGFR
jgi:ubiquitin C-terminal hydrolase